MRENEAVAANEARARALWADAKAFVAPERPKGRPFSMFLVPPNASGPLHIGNALMVAIQDVLARYHRMKGDSTLWIPGTDHGGYETQITFEKELERDGGSKDLLSVDELHDAIEKFVHHNNDAIDSQIERLGASVDWTRRRFTLDQEGQNAVEQVFDRMLTDDLIYRRSYMVNYCPSCATVLADIELKHTSTPSTRYLVNFQFTDGDGGITLAVDRPEFLFTVTHVLVHQDDPKHAHLIGRTLVNPSTNADVVVEASKRVFDPEVLEEYLAPFMPSCVRYDYEYAIRHNIPAFDVIGWGGIFTERYPGLAPEDARRDEVTALRSTGSIVEEVPHETDRAQCKKGHDAIQIIRHTWFMRLDDERLSLKKNAIDAIQRERLNLFPQWRMKGLTEWLGKMHDWPIARQNVWGIKIPLWYEVTDPTLFTVWFRDQEGQRQHGRLDSFLAEGTTLDEVQAGLERVYAEEGCVWTREPIDGIEYLPETDTFDTWFSSGAWGTTVFGDLENKTAQEWYPSDVMVIGHDLLRLSVARKIFLSVYLSERLPFRSVYLHRLILAKDGQKMSKSLGNTVSLDEYLQRYGADVTRMALLSYTGSQEDFVFEDERLNRYQLFAHRVRHLEHACVVMREHGISLEGKYGTSKDLEELASVIGRCLERLRFHEAQDHATKYLDVLEVLAKEMLVRPDIALAAQQFYVTYMTYLRVLHPFMPHLTEVIYSNTKTTQLLALSPWPSRSHPPARGR